MQFRADQFDLELPDGWRDDSVIRLKSPDGEERLTMRLELREMDLSIDVRLAEKTRTVREGIPYAELVWTGDAQIGIEPAKAFRIIGQRGDEMPLTFYCVLARWGERRLLLVEYEGPTARWTTAEPMIRRFCASVRRPAP